MEDSSIATNTLTTTIPATLLGHNISSQTLLDDYESGMEASVSSMDSGGDEDDDVKDNEVQRKDYQRQLYKNSIKRNKDHRRMSSGSMSTDSNAPPIVIKKKYYASHQKTAFNKINPIVTSRIQSSYSSYKVGTPNSGYEGDTEGPLNEDGNTSTATII